MARPMPFIAVRSAATMEEDRTEIIETTPRREVVADEAVRERRVVDTTPHRAEVVNTTPRVTEVTTANRPYSGVDRTESVAYDPYEGRRLAAVRITQLVYWL